MHRRILVAFTYCFVASAIAASRAQTPSPQAQPQTATVPADNDPIKTMVDRLDLEKYKATIKGLTQFGDRRQGTDRNRAAVDWIEAQLKSYGCTNTERIKYDYQPPPDAARRRPASAPKARRRRGAGCRGGRGPARTRTWRAGRRTASRHPRAHRRQHRSQAAARREAPRAQLAADHAGTARGGLLHEGRHHASRRDVHRRRHMDGHGWGEAANDDGSGTALVMELARVFSSPDVQTERSIRFALWNNEETGLERRARLRRAAAGRCRARRTRRARASIRSRSGSA